MTINFDIKEPETYEKAKASNLAEEWAEAIKQEIDSLIKYEIWDFIPISDVKLDHFLLIENRYRKLNKELIIRLLVLK